MMIKYIQSLLNRLLIGVVFWLIGCSPGDSGLFLLCIDDIELQNSVNLQFIRISIDFPITSKLLSSELKIQQL